ncbi:hypothetical protein DN069_04530 [Streptacidiphilus pinicola]|uniref:Uncharacterized protein n=1 Tax=Streptacidiphilus pinicola TaxID=2219663 RepID=A0A2X0IQ88_9ACTN|nr:hypothetical protein [Streptacidiphilus pinicola]RAG86807.1 hypothetical protein DN069_04530 [Streptacidiphilus pinicola]
MTHEALDHAYPVEIAALTPGEHGRQVRIERPGTTPVVVVCSSRRQFEEVLGRERPDIGPDDEQLVHWADHPGQWTAT